MSQRLKTFLSASSELRQLSGKAGELMVLQRLYQQVAPASLSAHTHVVQLRQHILTLAANNGAIAAKLKQLTPLLIQQLQNKGCEVTGIQVRVQVNIRKIKPATQRAKLSREGEKSLICFASELADSPLKNAIQHLIKSAK